MNGYIVKIHENRHFLLGLNGNLQLGLSIRVSSVVKVMIKVKVRFKISFMTLWLCQSAELPPGKDS